MSLTPETLKRAALTLIVMLLSLSVHECSHAFVADRLGDDTPRSQGRLTLSPMAHYDVLGTFVIPLFAAVSGTIGLIGWARPVEVSPQRFSRRFSMRSGMMLVAVAGPLSNLLLAIVSAAALALAGPTLQNTSGSVGALLPFLRVMCLSNLGLFVFNLLPIPPLDGSRLLPRSFDPFLERVAPYSLLLLLVVMMGVPQVIYLPVRTLAIGLQSLFQIPQGVL